VIFQWCAMCRILCCDMERFHQHKYTREVSSASYQFCINLSWNLERWLYAEYLFIKFKFWSQKTLFDLIFQNQYYNCSQMWLTLMDVFVCLVKLPCMLFVTNVNVSPYLEMYVCACVSVFQINTCCTFRKICKFVVGELYIPWNNHLKHLWPLT